MHNMPILIILVCAIVAALFFALKRNRKDETKLEDSFDAADDEEGLRSRKRPGEKEEL
jgi:hypothetical protein